jgi:putative Mg2+ transporter-C (MgtC) family protein
MAAMVLDIGDIGLRLGAAALCGVVLGINRDLQNKPIGARTLGLVALGAATVAVAGIQFPGMAENPDAASRVIQGVIQGVMAGISFIGAGVILRDPTQRTVDNLTTAATVWVTAALGVACGLAAWRSVAVAIAVSLVLLVVAYWLELAFTDIKDEDKNKASKSKDKKT